MPNHCELLDCKANAYLEKKQLIGLSSTNVNILDSSDSSSGVLLEMLFNSFEFVFLFFPITLFGFFLISEKFGQQKGILWLIGASFFFYAWWSPKHLALLIFSLLFNFKCGQLLNPLNNNFIRTALLTIGISANLLILVYFKYSNFLLDQLNAATGAAFHLDQILLPLAISFFTFQQIAYLVDSYSGKVTEHSFFRYALFVSFFPQLIAGPIVHHSETMPQFEIFETYQPNPRYMTIGIILFSIGLFKKCIFADGVAPTANLVFNSTHSLSFFDAWIGALAYSLQLYFDFSGYSDMAIGLAYMFGIRLPINFNSPYKASSIIDFWRRWHITLSRFLKDYLYIPLGGSKKGDIRKYINLFITMLLGGIWHGAGWTFVIWGALHGTYLITNHYWQKIRRTSLSTENTLLKAIFYRALTLLSIVVAWVYFRASDIESANIILKTMFGRNGISLPSEFAPALGNLTPLLSKIGVTFGELTQVQGLEPLEATAAVGALLVVVFGTPSSASFLQRLEDFNVSAKITKLFLLIGPYVVGAAFVMAVSTFMSVSEFLYFNF